MLFNEEDFKLTFKLEGKGPVGFYNLVDWTVDGGKDLTLLAAEMVTLHEWAHWSLNNSTAFGMILQTYAIIQEEFCGQNTAYLKILQHLAQECFIAHEVYATWMGIAMMKKSRRDGVETLLLAEYPLYHGYYNQGELLVGDIEDSFLAVLTLNAIIGFCFQSASISKAAVMGLDAFKPWLFRPVEFPNTRLTLISANFASNDIWALAKEYLNTAEGSGLDRCLKKRNESPNNHFSRDDYPYIVDFVRHIYDFFGVFFEKRHSPSIDQNGHFEIAKVFAGQVEAMFPGQGVFPTLFADPLDIHRNLLVSCDLETIVVRDMPMAATLRFPLELTGLDKDQLYQCLSEEPLVLTACTPYELYHQFSWADAGHKAWLLECEAVVTCLQIVEDGGLVVIPFANPEELNDVLGDLPDNFRVIAQITMTCWQDKWVEQWWEVFWKGCEDIFYINDYSLLIYIEDLIAEKKEPSYLVFRYALVEREFKAVVFQFPHEGKVVKSVICPCSAAYSKLAIDYLERNAPNLKHESIMTQEQESRTFQVMRHLFSRIHFWHYRTQLVSDRLTKNTVVSP